MIEFEFMPLQKDFKMIDAMELDRILSMSEVVGRSQYVDLVRIINLKINLTQLLASFSTKKKEDSCQIRTNPN